MIPEKEWNDLAQRAHWLGGLCAVLAGFIADGWKGAIVGGFAIGIWATWKELWWDPHHENAAERCDSRKGDWEDLAYYFVGIGLAFCYLIIATGFSFGNSVK
jgi:hypothetical protein